MVLYERLSFGPFEFEPQSGRLTKHGHRIKLQPKSAAILSCLLDHPGEVVTRDQLQKRLWQEGVHVDFELGIKVAVQKLRQALCDDSSQPVYIQTVHGEGYRFIAALEAIEDPPVRPVEMELAPEVPQGLFARPRIVWLAAAAVVLVMIAGATLLPRGNPAASLHFQDRDWIIVVPFENRTGDALLDGTMDLALERALSESRYVNVAPRERINDALTLMRQSPATKLSEDLARQVATRDGGIKAVIGGRVEKLGSKYVLTVRLLNPEGSQPIAFIEKTGAKEGLLEAAQSASDDLRRKLGEKSFHRETPAHLEKATTASLAALRAFSAGMEQVNLYNWSLAAPLLEEAVLQDPQFATAHIYAAHTYSNLQQPEKAAPHYQAAFQLASGVTQRERLFILGSYYQRFLNDYEQAIDAYTALVNLYPDDYWGTNNLIGLLQLRVGETLAPVEDHWQRGEVTAAANELDPVNQEATKPTVRYHNTYQLIISEANLTLGKLGAAKDLCASIANPAMRDECFLRVAFSSGDRQLGQQHLAHLRTTVPMNLALHTDHTDIVIAVWLGDTALVDWWSEHSKSPNSSTVAGVLLLTRGRREEAIEKLSLPLGGVPLFNDYYLASALEQQGRVEEAINVLARRELQKLHVRLAWAWPPTRLKLAELYRKSGRTREAEHVEDEMRHYLAAADPDHPVLRALARHPAR